LADTTTSGTAQSGVTTTPVVGILGRGGEDVISTTSTHTRIKKGERKNGYFWLLKNNYSIN
jgi:hypothetical protein